MQPIELPIKYRGRGSLEIGDTLFEDIGVEIDTREKGMQTVVSGYAAMKDLDAFTLMSYISQPGTLHLPDGQQLSITFSGKTKVQLKGSNGTPVRFRINVNV